MGMKRVANDRSKYTPRSNVGQNSQLRQDVKVNVSARREFVATSDGYFVWGCAKKSET